jgi:hypothetical protein
LAPKPVRFADPVGVGLQLRDLGAPSAFVFAEKFAGATGSVTYVYYVIAPNGRRLMTLSTDTHDLIDGI